MSKFNFIASTATGETQRGTLEASSKADLAKKLKTKSLFLVSCSSDDDHQNGAPKAALPPASEPRRLLPRQESTQSASFTGTAPQGPGSNPQNWINNLLHPGQKADPNVMPKGKVSLKELVVLTRQLSISINAGMSFVEALQGLATNTSNPVLGWVLRKILDDVLSGKRFSDALAGHPDIFKPVYVSMTAAGEAGGFMPDALNRTAEFLEKEIELRSKIKSAMVYPAVIAVVASIVVIGMMAFIVPTFVKLFQDMNAPLFARADAGAYYLQQLHS